MNYTEDFRVCKEQTHRSSTPTWSSRGRSTSTQRVGGGPSNEFAIKDIIIVGLQCEITPTTRQEKARLPRRNHVISGFPIDKGWNAKVLSSNS